MAKVVSICLLLVISLFFLTNSQSAFAEEDFWAGWDCLWLFCPGWDWDKDGYNYEVDSEPKDPCIPDQTVARCPDSIIDPPPEDEIIKLIKKTFRHIPLIPPSTNYSPGAIVTMKKGKPDGIPICTQGQVLGGEFQEKRSPTNLVLLKDEFKIFVDANANAGFGQSIRAEIGVQADYLNGVTLSFDNPVILTIESEATALKRVKEGNFLEECAERVKEILDVDSYDELALTIIESVIQADVSYALDLKAGIDAEADIKVIEEGVSFVLTGEKTTGELKVGKELFWGLKTNDRLFESLKNRMLDSLGDN